MPTSIAFVCYAIPNSNETVVVPEITTLSREEFTKTLTTRWTPPRRDKAFLEHWLELTIVPQDLIEEQWAEAMSILARLCSSCDSLVPVGFASVIAWIAKRSYEFGRDAATVHIPGENNAFTLETSRLPYDPKALLITIDDLFDSREISARTYNCLMNKLRPWTDEPSAARKKPIRLFEIVVLSSRELMNIKHFGRVAMAELRDEILQPRGLTVAMALPPEVVAWCSRCAAK